MVYSQNETMRRIRQIYYDGFSRVYDRFIAMHATGASGALKRYLADETGLAAGDAVLDVCTGTGAMLPYLHERTGDGGLVAGADFSSGMLRAAKGKNDGSAPVFLVQADAARLPFKDGAFDAVTCAHAFYELKGAAQTACLKEINRCLKPGRPFLMMEHDVPEKRFIRMLFYLRLLSMGFKRAVDILKHEEALLSARFRTVRKINTPTGRSKIMVCRT